MTSQPQPERDPRLVDDPIDASAPRPDPEPGEVRTSDRCLNESASGLNESATESGATAAERPAEPEWWEADGLPWKHKPTRSDIACMGWIGFMGVFGLAMLPLRGWLLGLNPPLLVSLTGSRSGTAALGALAGQGQAHRWWLPLVLGALMSIKFDWVYWWAGKLWGRGLIEVWAGRSARASRNYARAERWAEKFGWVGMFIAYVPIPLPLMQVIFVLTGAQGWSWKKFMLLDFIASTLWLGVYFVFGWQVGEPAVRLLKDYAKIANYVAIVLVVFVVGSVFWQQNRSKKSSAA